MDISGVGTVADVVIAISTVIYTVGTFLLWRSTKLNTELLAVQAQELLKHESRSASFNRVVIDNSIVDAHRELWSMILSNQRLFDLLTSKSEPSEENTAAASWLGSMLINHCSRVHLAHHEKIYSEIDIDAFARDARYLFDYPLVRWRWKSVAKYHSQEFRDFVDKWIEA